MRLIVYRVDLIIHCFFTLKEGGRQAGRQRVNKAEVRGVVMNYASV